MYPHIFVENITTGYTTIRCDCTKQCTTKGLPIEPIESKTGHGNKLRYYDVENTPPSVQPLLYKYDATAIGKWSQQVSKYFPICPSPRSSPFFDLPIASPPPPPYTPRRRRLTNSSDISDHPLQISQLKKQKSGMDFLIDAVDLLPNTSADNNGAEHDSMESTSTILQDDEGRDYDLVPIIVEYNNKFANLFMLADEAVKRINSTEPMET